MSDWIGVLFFILLAAGVFAGLKALSKPRVSTEEEFEKRSAESVSMLGAGLSALNEMMDPQAAKAKEVITQMKEGRYMKKKREGKAGGTDGEGSGELE